MSYEDTLHYLYNLERFGMKLDLSNITAILNILDNPHLKYPAIHIAGTNGKGSVAAMLHSILCQSGHKVGLYTSPHLSDFRERIRILSPSIENRASRIEFEGMISKRALTDLIEELRPYIQEYNSQSKYGSLSFFEAYTALAFMYFKKMQVDFCVLETGLGETAVLTTPDHCPASWGEWHPRKKRPTPCLERR